MSSTRAVRNFLILWLVFPFLVLFYLFRPSVEISLGEFWWAFQNSALQAFLSSLFSLIGGFWAALGLIAARGRSEGFRRTLEVISLLPNFLPPIFILLATLSLVDPFPMGIAGIVLVHSVINFGLVGVLLARIIEEKMGGFAELAYIEGASRFYFLRKVFFPILKKDFLLVGLFVFTICFSSFAVPLVVGGGRGTTLEVLIYEKIRLSTEWGQAVFIALVQSVFVFCLSLVVSQQIISSKVEKKFFKIIEFPSGILLILFVNLFLLWGFSQGLLNSIENLEFFQSLQREIWQAVVGSFLIALSSGIFVFLFLLLIVWSFPDRILSVFLRGYVAPSTALVCFCFLILGPNYGLWAFIKIPLAFASLVVANLYRLGLESQLKNLNSQVVVAQTMGAGRKLIFFEILLPQTSRTVGLLSGLAAVWASGDFAISRILAQHDLTVAMMTESLMSGYRLNQSTVLSLLIVVIGLACFFIFLWGGHVLSRKSIS